MGIGLLSHLWFVCQQLLYPSSSGEGRNDILEDSRRMYAGLLDFFCYLARPWDLDNAGDKMTNPKIVVDGKPRELLFQVFKEPQGFSVVYVMHKCSPEIWTTEGEQKFVEYSAYERLLHLVNTAVSGRRSSYTRALLQEVESKDAELESLRKKNERLVNALERIAVDSDENTGFSRSEDECAFYIDVAKKTLAETATTPESDSGGGTTSSIDSDEDFAPIGKTKRLISIDEYAQLLEQATALASALEEIRVYVDEDPVEAFAADCAFIARAALADWTAFREGHTK